MLGKRVLTAIIGIPVAVYVINYGQWLFAVTTTLISLLAWHEFCRMLKNKNINICYSLGIISILGLLGCSWLGNSQEFIMILTVVTMLTMFKNIINFKNFNIMDAAFTLLGILYIGVLFSHLILLRFTDNLVYIKTNIGEISAGAAYLWLAFIGTWASDTFAYFIGSWLGSHKLCPQISPGKTVEGFIGGIVGSIAAIALLGNLFHIPYLHSILMGTLIGVLAPGGDLIESSLKRFAGVKDSGNVLPGHGGILDRFDSILFAVPLVYYYTHLFMLG